MMLQLWLALCLTCLPVLAQAEQLVLDDRVNATVTGWDYSGPGWTYGKFAARIRWPFGLGVSSYGTTAFWLRSTRPHGDRYADIAVVTAPYDSDEPESGEYLGLLDVWSPFPFVHATREMSIYTRRNLRQWHNYSVAWRPGSIVWAIDGVTLGRVSWVPGDGSPWSQLDEESLVPSIRGESYHPAQISWVKIWR